MAGPPPDRGKDPKRQPQPLNFVRGGSVCSQGEKGGHVVKGTQQAAVCMPTVGSDTRSRWRVAGKAITPPSRHSVSWAQHRKGPGG
jgi:hypothetical protein